MNENEVTSNDMKIIKEYIKKISKDNNLIFADTQKLLESYFAYQNDNINAQDGVNLLNGESQPYDEDSNNQVR